MAMKKLICIIITIATLFLVSCGGTTPIEEPTETPAPGARYRGVVEGKSRILLFHGGTLWYYSKVDGESYNFCFDPLCRHSLKNDFCISRLFSNHLYMTEGCVYSEKYDRFYFTRGQNIYSTSFDASDLKLEYSFGENGKIDRSLKSADLIEYNTNLSCLRIHGDYLFFIRANDDTGTWQIVRYNIVTKKAEEMTASEGEWITLPLGNLLAEEDGINLLQTDVADAVFTHHILKVDESSGFYIAPLGEDFEVIVQRQPHLVAIRVG